MCRANVEGGRRCPGCVGKTGRAKHNARRRANRAIRKNVAEWARQQGDVPPEEIAELEAAPPKVAKDWIKARGHNPEDFLNGVPDAPDAPDAPEGPGSADRPAQAGSGAAPAAPSPAGPPAPLAPAAAAGGGRRRGAAPGAGGAAGARSHGGGAEPPGAAPWQQEDWCTPQLREQITHLQQVQGDHRDERNLLGGTPEKVTPIAEGTNTTERIELSNGVTGYFKPFDGVNDRIAFGFGQDSAQQSLHEVAAWRLAEQMGSPWNEIVPPVVVREVRGRVGSFALERPGKINCPIPIGAAEWQEAAFFDSLIGQQDRHPQNYLLSGDRITLIDHGYTFARPGDYENYSWIRDIRRRADPQLSSREREVLQRLVASPDLMGMRKVLQPDRADALQARAERMLLSGRITSRF